MRYEITLALQLLNAEINDDNMPVITLGISHDLEYFLHHTKLVWVSSTYLW